MESKWEKLRTTIHQPASKTIGFTQKRHQDWFDDNSAAIQDLLETKRKALDALPELPSVPSLDEPPQFKEVLSAIRSLKNNKSPGPDGLPAEILKKGGYLLIRQLYYLICNIWQKETLPQEWKDSNIVTIYKRKGDKSVCGDSHGTAGKILAKIMLFRLTMHITEDIHPETQCGFRKD